MIRIHPLITRRHATACSSVVLLILAISCGSHEPNASPDSAAGESQTVFASLQPGWNTFEPGGETTCSDGSAFRFFARPGDPEKLLVYFQGGGGCWTGATCDRDLEPTYTTTAREQLIEAKVGEPRPEGAMNGIFDYTRTENPLGHYSAVFVPYCTGDVHLGNRTATYQAPESEGHAAHEVTVEHRGYVNVLAALEWTYSAFDAPAEIFVSGSSAGSIPSPYYAHRIKDHYPSARVTQLGDASGGYRRSPGQALPHEQWDMQSVVGDIQYLADLPSEELNYVQLYIAAAKENPGVTFAQYDTANDAVQLRFLEISGGDVKSLLELLDANRADIEAEVNSFRSFTAGGDSHTILGRESFYTLRVGEVTFRDWLADLLAGHEVENVHCEDCSVEETT